MADDLWIVLGCYIGLLIVTLTADGPSDGDAVSKVVDVICVALWLPIVVTVFLMAFVFGWVLLGINKLTGRGPDL